MEPEATATSGGQSKYDSVEKYVAVAYSAVVALTVHDSALPTPSVTHAPLLVTWQYAEPDTTDHIWPAATGGAGEYTGGGGEGLGGGGAMLGGIERGSAAPQIVKPPPATEKSASHEIVAPDAIGTFVGPDAPE